MNVSMGLKGAVLIALSLQLLSAISAAAQSVSPAQNQPQPVLHAQATTVVVDVVVTQKGKPLVNIDRKRFHIYDENREQNIGFMEEHKAATTATAPEFKPLPPHYYSNLPTKPVGSAVNLLLLDAMNTPLADQMEVRRQMLKYLATIEPGTMMAVFTLTSRLRMIQGFTSNSDQLVKAIKSVQTNPQKSTLLDETGLNTDTSNLAMMQIPGPNLAALQQFQSGVAIVQTDQRVGMTLQALQQLAGYLGSIPGRKNLIWFSGSFPILLSGDAAAMAHEEPRSYDEQVHTTSQMLATARIAVYPIDTEGIMPLANFNLGSNDGLVTPPATTTPQEHFAMDDLAKSTGGLAFFNTNDFRKAVAAAVDNGANYYTIAYTPDVKDFHGQFRKVKVHIDDCECQLAYRDGYYAQPPGKESPVAALIASATQHGAPPTTGVIFQTRVLSSADPDVKDANLPRTPIGDQAASLKQPTRRFIADIVVDPHSIVLDDEPGGAHGLAIEFALIAYDADGKRINSVDRNLKASISADRYAQMMASGVPVRIAIDVPSAPTSLVISVHDRISSHVGSIEVPLTN